MERQKRIALYGGSFDPVHVGHTSVARSLLELFALDEVLFIPAYLAPHKRERRVTPALQRYAMLALATQGEPRFLVSSIELDAPEKPYTVETLAHLQATLGQSARLFFVMGADSWMEIETWREWERVLELAEHLVVTRPGYELDAAHVTEAVTKRIVDLRGAGRERVAQELESGSGRKIYLTDAVELDVSASAIRRAVQTSGMGAGEVLDRLVAPAVADYIRKYELYKNLHEREFFSAGNQSEAHHGEA